MTHLARKTADYVRSLLPTSLTTTLLPALLLTGLAAPGILRAQDEKLPKADAILDKYVEVTGGKAAYAKLKNRVTKATLEFVGQGLKLSLTNYVVSPHKIYGLMESEAIGKIERGYDGKVAWQIHPMTGPQIMEGDERALLKQSAVLDAPVQWRRLYKKAECVGIEDVDGKACYKIIVTAEDGPAETRYYDKQSNLVTKIELTLSSPMGSIPTESYPSDYKSVDGVLLPHKARVLVMGTERLMTIESVKHNVEIPKDRFKLPEQIQELLEQRKGEETKTEKP